MQGSAASFQLSGTVSSTGTTTIDGDGTAFSTELVVGESVIIGSQAYTVPLQSANNCAALPSQQGE